jgi:hypothetical protein
MIRNTTGLEAPSTNLTSLETFTRTDISNEEKFNLVGRIVVEAANKFEQQDIKLNEYREKLSETEKTIDILGTKVNRLTLENTQLVQDTSTLKSTVSEMKKQNVQRMCEKEINNLIASKASCIHRKNAAYAGSVLLGFTLVGIAAMAPTIMHGMDISEEIMRIRGKMKAIETVPECIMFPEIYEDLSNSYYECYKWEDMASYNFSADPGDSASWNTVYSGMNESCRTFFLVASENLKKSISDAKNKTGSYYT